MAKEWTTTELRRLREHYPVGGVRLASMHLNRSPQAITIKANELRLKAPHGVGSAWGVIKPDPFTDQAIRDAYANGIERGTIRKLAVRLGRPYWWIARRARNLGLIVPRGSEPKWTELEYEIIATHAHLCVERISKILKQQGFTRSPTAIAGKLNRMDLQRRETRRFAGTYSAAHTARLFGVDQHTVARWIRMGKLKAKPLGTKRTEDQNGDEWAIEASDIRAFAVDHPSAFDLRRVDQIWFLTEIVGRKAA